MQTLEVTDEQYAVIQQLREEISEQVVGKYGFVRERDAVQFLIDNLDGNPDIDVAIDTDLDSSATDDVAASVGAAIDGEPTPDDLEEVSYIEDDAAADADVVEPDSAPEPDVGDESEDEEENEPTDASSDEDASSEDETEPDAGSADGDSDESSDGDAADDSSDGDGSADDDDMLDEMMSLLETHDDKWAESDAADYRYEVELPDGTTEQVQTKDDVRALLFKNYR